MDDRPKETERHVSAVLAALRILDCFRSDNGLRLQDLHHRTGINKSRILRYVGTLEAAGMLHFDAANRHYELGPKLFYLGRVIETHYATLLGLLQPLLDDLVAATDSVAYFSIRRGSDRLVLLRRSPPWQHEPVVKNGQVRPLLLGANSRVLLAFEDEEERERLLRRLGPMMTDAERQRLEDGIVAARRSGHAVAFEETRRAQFVVSVPVLGNGSHLQGALALSSPTGPDQHERATRHIKLLKAAALRLQDAIASAGAKPIEPPPNLNRPRRLPVR